MLRAVVGCINLMEASGRFLPTRAWSDVGSVPLLTDTFAAVRRPNPAALVILPQYSPVRIMNTEVLVCGVLLSVSVKCKRDNICQNLYARIYGCSFVYTDRQTDSVYYTIITRYYIVQYNLMYFGYGSV